MPDQLRAWCPWCEAVTPQAIKPAMYQPPDGRGTRYWCDVCMMDVTHHNMPS